MAEDKNLFKLVELQERESEKLEVEPYSYWKSVIKEFKKKPSAIVAVVLLALLVLFSIFVPLLSPYDPYATTVTDRSTLNLLPSFKHWFGTDAAGRDYFTYIWYGARKSLTIAAIAAVINIFNGVLIGVIWGYFRKIDILMLEFYNFIVNIPGMLLYMLLLYVLGSLGTSPEFNLVFTLTITGWVHLARFIRNQIIIYNNREYNIASRTLGTPASRVITHNLLPYVLPVIVTQISFEVPALVGAEVSLSYFGLGLRTDQISLGRIIAVARNNFVAFPHIMIFPALVTGALTILFYLIGLSLSDALDPKTHR